MTDELVRDNQTQFSSEEALLTSSYLPNEPLGDQPSQPKSKLLWIVVLAAGAVLVLIGVMLWLAMGMKPPTTVVLPSVTPSATAQPVTGWQARVKSLQAELDAADPTRQSLTFPQVDLKLTLDEPKR